MQAGAERRRAGGQPGHRGAGRKLLPEDQVDAIVAHYPERCEGCGHAFSEEERAPSGRPGRHQVAELPPIRVIVSEHRTHRLRCPRCRRRTTAAPPAEVSGSAFGPRLQAAVVTISARNRVSRRDMSELAGELFGIGLAVGTVDAVCQRAGAALQEPHERLVASVLESGALNIDETGWFRAGQGRTRFGRLTWPHFGRLIWPHPRPTATRPFGLFGARAGGRRGDGIEGGAVRADP